MRRVTVVVAFGATEQHGPDKREAGYTGDMESAIGAIFGAGVQSVADNGVIGDPAQASAEHGARYWEMVEAITLTAVAPPG